MTPGSPLGFVLATLLVAGCSPPQDRAAPATADPEPPRTAAPPPPRPTTSAPAPRQAPAPAPAAASDDAATYLSVLALSRGKGVPPATREAMTSIRARVETAAEAGVVRTWDTRRIGIEGETRLCIEFADRARGAEFEREIRRMADGVELMNVVAEPCPPKK